MPNFTLNYSGTGYTPLGVTTSANITEVIDANIANNTANYRFDSVVFANTSLQSIFGYVSGGNLTVVTNNTTVPSAANQTFAFVANTPIAWNVGSPANNPFTGNVSNGIFVTNTSGNTVTLNLTFNYN